MPYYERQPKSTARESVDCGGFSFFYDPAIWESQGYSDGSLLFSHYKDAAGISASIDKKPIDINDQKWQKMAIKEMNKRVPGVSFTTGTRCMVNGLPVFVLNASGKIDDEEIHGPMYIVSSNSCTLIVLGFVIGAESSPFDADVMGFLSGIVSTQIKQ